MRILILLRDLSPNGITTYNRILAKELSAQGHEVYVWPSDATISSREPLGLPLLHPWLAALVRRRVERIRPDLIFVNHYTQARLAHRLAASTGIPWFACMHNGHSPKRMAEWAALFANASGVITMSETLGKTYTELIAARTRSAAGHAAPPVLLSRLPIEMPPYNERPIQTPLTLTYCSRLSAQKGPRCESWLRAIASLPELRRHKLLVIGGGSYLRRLRHVARELGLQVVFTGVVTDPGPYLDRTDVITGAGYSLMEGLVRGCMPVALGFGGCLGAVTDDRLDGALAVNFGDHCVDELACDPATIARELMVAIEVRLAGENRAVTQRSIEHFSPGPIATQLAEFMARQIRVD